jgi:hypothetical protein
MNVFIFTTGSPERPEKSIPIVIPVYNEKTLSEFCWTQVNFRKPGTRL